MFNPTSHSIKFLRDENVKLRLEKFLREMGIDIVSKPKGLINGKLAHFSKAEKRVLITNDKDFSDSQKYPKDKIYSVILLKIPQDKPQLLIDSFSKMLFKLKSPKDFEGKVIALYENRFDITPILN